MTSSPNSILVTAPDYDRMTRYLATWAGKFIATIEPNHRQVYILHRNKVTRQQFETYLLKIGQN